MKRRCLNKNNPDYYLYGGRGITLCKRWMLFDNFLKDMGKRPKGLTLERINNNLGYYPENCIWASQLAQRHNRRPHNSAKETKNAD